MQANKTPRVGTWILLIAIAVLAAGLGMWVAQKNAPRTAAVSLPDGVNATVLSTPRPISPFTLVDHHNQPFTLENLKHKWTFLFFGYTRCPDICPTTLATLDAVDAKLRKQPQDHENMQVVFVSVDPERDPPEHLAQFVPYFNKDFIGATGTPEEIKALTAQLGVMYVRSAAPNESNPDNYWIDHTASILLVDPEARLHALFSAPHDPAAIAAAFAAIRRHHDN